MSANISVQRDWVGAAVAASGGALVVIGAWLPWITLFAGLQRYSGVTGLYGRIVFIGGAVSIGGAVAILGDRRRWIRLSIGAVGVALALLAAWDLVGLRATMRQLGGHPLLLARPGPGLFVALCGALVVAVLLFRASHLEESDSCVQSTPRTAVPRGDREMRS